MLMRLLMTAPPKMVALESGMAECVVKPPGEREREGGGRGREGWKKGGGESDRERIRDSERERVREVGREKGGGLGHCVVKPST